MSRAKTSRGRGRRPGQSGSREAILAAARVAFARDAYAGTTLRGIAREAGVDVALIGHFFGSKAKLFVAVTDWPYDPVESLAASLVGGPDEVGRRLATFFFERWRVPEERAPILDLFMTAFDDATIAAMVREFFIDEVFVPLLEELGSDQVPLRAGLLGSQLQGLVMSRYVLGMLPVDAIDDAVLVAAVAPTLQRYATGELTPA